MKQKRRRRRRHGPETGGFGRAGSLADRYGAAASWRWYELTDEEKLEALKRMLEETDEGCRALTDETLQQLIEDAGGDLRRAAYAGALRKARNDGITLPDGTRLESQREYWLTIARNYRQNRTGGAPRADGR